MTIGKAKRVACNQGKAEIKLHKENVANINLPPDCPTPSAPIEKVYHFLFGSTSKLKDLFCDQLQLETEDYLLFLISFFKSCRYKMSVPNLHLSDDQIKNLMSTKKYNSIWKRIVDLPRHAHGESFWQKVESQSNRIFEELFMSPESVDIEGDEQNQFHYVIGLDDDKLHYNHTPKTVADGLKKGHHARDNRCALPTQHATPLLLLH